MCYFHRLICTENIEFCIHQSDEDSNRMHAGVCGVFMIIFQCYLVHLNLALEHECTVLIVSHAFYTGTSGIHVLYSCYTCVILVFYLCYTFVILVLYLCYTCVIHVLYMFYNCVMLVFYLCYTGSIENV